MPDIEDEMLRLAQEALAQQARKMIMADPVVRRILEQRAIDQLRIRYIA